MEKHTEIKNETKKEWTQPELTKLSVEMTESGAIPVPESTGGSAAS